MDRKALLIGCPGGGGTHYLSGVAQDLANYDRYLRSPLGGGWYSSEISTLDYPSAAAVRAAIQSLESIDYSFVLFSGHGYVTSNARSTIVCLRGDEEMDSVTLHIGAKKHTVLLDCCRVVAKPMVLAEDALTRMDSIAKSLRASACRVTLRKRFPTAPPG
jgi:hypothetical protein